MSNREQTYFLMQTTFNPDDIGKEINPGPAITKQGSDYRHTAAELDEVRLRFADYIQREEEMYNYEQGKIESI